MSIVGNKSHRFNVVVTKKARERQKRGCEDPVLVSSYLERRQEDEVSEKQEEAQKVFGD